jgi:type I restriction-modification system DNA methylase subunit
MESKELSEKVLNLFCVDSVSKLGSKLKETVLTNDTSKYAEFVNIVEDLSIDWMQKIYQYYEADRKDKKQDYTPKSLSKLVAKLTETNGEVVYDICAGSGALTIQKWCLSPQKTFICEELDENVFPYLAFNMAVRNMNGYIIMRNVLSLELTAVYQVIKGNIFSTVKQIQEIPDIKADEIISNPPYNIKWDAPEPLFADERFQGKVIPPASNANYAFVMTALSRLSEKGKCAFILPCGVLNSKPEKESRKYLVDNGYLETVIELPDNMFECTSIATCIYLFSKGNKTVKMYNCREKAVQEEREQRGQFGSKSHTNRVYKKVFNVLSDELIDVMCNKCENIEGFSNIATRELIENNDYTLAPNRYIQFKETPPQPHRELKEIVENINYITKMQNSCKLVINETIAESLGLDIEQFKESKQQSAETAKQMKSLGLDFVVEDYISFTKSKNEFALKCNDKDIFPDILRQFFSVWKGQIALLNTMQNTYLTELRDALLPDLMSGKIKL